MGSSFMLLTMGKVFRKEHREHGQLQVSLLQADEGQQAGVEEQQQLEELPKGEEETNGGVGPKCIIS